MLGKGLGMTITTSSDSPVDIENLNVFQILSAENKLGDNEVIFQDGNAYCSEQKLWELFLMKGTSIQ